MAVLPVEHDGDRSVRMVDLGRSADATRGDGARVRRVGREEGDVDANGDVVGLRRTVRQRRDRRRDGSHIVFKDWEAADGARLREEDSLVDRVRDEGRLAWARARGRQSGQRQRQSKHDCRQRWEGDEEPSSPGMYGVVLVFHSFPPLKESAKQPMRKGLPYKDTLQEIVRPDQPESGLPSGKEKRGSRWRNVAFLCGGYLSK